MTPAADRLGLGSIEDYRVGTLRLARVLGAAGVVSVVGGVVLLASIPSGLAARYRFPVAVTVLTMLVVAACALTMLVASRANHAGSAASAARARNLVVTACLALVVFGGTSATYPTAFSREMCFDVFQDRANPLLEDDTASCLDALPTVPKVAWVSTALALVTLIYGWYVTYRYIRLRRGLLAATPTGPSGRPSPPDLPTTAAQPIGIGIASELERLARLRRDGVINDEEFDAAKRRLLDTG